jgi:hypothetical protein
MGAPRVIFSHHIEAEDSDPRRELSFKETGADHSEWIAWIEERLDEEGPISSAWCHAVVKASVEFIVGDDELSHGGRVIGGRAILGGCSYPSEHRLWVDNLDQMQDDALSDLIAEIRTEIGRIPVSKTKEFMLVTLDLLLEENGR